MRTFLILAIYLSFISASVFAAEFSYSGITGPAFWGCLNETFSDCLHGTRQSPIDIPTNEFSYARPYDVKFDDDNNVYVENKGHTVEVKAKAAKMIIDSEEFSLIQFHFHTPSEHLVDGRYHDVEAHFVFTSSDSKISVIGVFYDVSDQESEFLKPIIDKLPLEEGIVDEIEFIKLSSVLKDINDMNEAYTYPGSLTTPPCSEGVTWWVNNPVLPIGKDQYIKLRDTMGFNSRFAQVREGEAGGTHIMSCSCGN